MEDPPPYSSYSITDLRTNGEKIRKYTFREGIHILLLENGYLYLQGEGIVYRKDRIIYLLPDELLLISTNVADFEGYLFYNYNGSKRDNFKVYSNSGNLILEMSNGSCTLL